MELPFNSGTEPTAMAAACYPLARAAATGIEQDVLDLISPKPKREAQALALQLQRGAIFDKGVLASLHDLVGVLDAEIIEGIVSGLKFGLMQDEAYAEFRDNFLARKKAEAEESGQVLKLLDKTIHELKTKIANIVRSVEDGDAPTSLTSRLKALETDLKAAEKNVRPSALPRSRCRRTYLRFTAPRLTIWRPLCQMRLSQVVRATSCINGLILWWSLGTQKRNIMRLNCGASYWRC